MGMLASIQIPQIIYNFLLFGGGMYMALFVIIFIYSLCKRAPVRKLAICAILAFAALPLVVLTADGWQGIRCTAADT